MLSLLPLTGHLGGSRLRCHLGAVGITFVHGIDTPTFIVGIQFSGACPLTRARSALLHASDTGARPAAYLSALHFWNFSLPSVTISR